MSVRAFTLDSGNNIYSEMYGGNYYTNGITGTRATRNATVSNQRILAKNIASSHTSELKNAYEYLEDGNISGFQSVLDGIASSESAKQRTYNITDEEIKSAVESAYEQVIGVDYDTSIAGSKQSSFMSGLNESLFFGIFSGDSKSAAEYSAERRGTTVNADEQNKKNLGNAVGIAATAATAGLIVATAVAKEGILAAIGSAVGTVATGLFSGPVGWAMLGVAAVGTIVALAKNKK